MKNKYEEIKNQSIDTILDFYFNEIRELLSPVLLTPLDDCLNGGKGPIVISIKDIDKISSLFEKMYISGEWNAEDIDINTIKEDIEDELEFMFSNEYAGKKYLYLWIDSHDANFEEIEKNDPCMSEFLYYLEDLIKEYL